MKRILLIAFLLIVIPIRSQTAYDENIQALKDQYNQSSVIRCDILIQVDVVGMSIPDKKIHVTFRGDENPKVKGEGLSILPKKGTIDQFRKMLNSPMQAIYLTKRGNNLVYKLVSLDEKSDWITADIVFDEDRYLIYESVVNTRKFGTFSAFHQYEDQIYPARSVIKFEVKKFNLPLKFIGGEQTTSQSPNKGEKVKGKITLTYTYTDG